MIIGLVALVVILVAPIALAASSPFFPSLMLSEPRLVTTSPSGSSPGSSAVIAIDISHSPENDNTTPFVLFIEARDRDGVTVFLANRTGVLEKASSQLQVNATWPVGQSGTGDFEVRAFAISGMEDLQVLSYVNKSSVALDGPDCSAPESCVQGTVTKIVDGDTLDIGSVRIRLALVNTPEVGESGYGEAKAFTAALCPVGSTAFADVDKGQPGGSYGRTVAKVTCGGKILNAELLKSGHAMMLGQFCSVSEFADDDWARQGCRPAGNGGQCDPSYPDVCIPSPPPDLDCSQLTFRNFRVLQPDPHHFDPDKDGFGCES